MRALGVTALAVCAAVQAHAGTFGVSFEAVLDDYGVPPLSIRFVDTRPPEPDAEDIATPRIVDGHCVFPVLEPIHRTEGGEILFTGLCGRPFEIRFTIANLRDLDSRIRIRQAFGLRVCAKERDFYAVAFFGGRENPNSNEPEAVYRDPRSFACRPDLTHPDPARDPFVVPPSPMPATATIRFVVDDGKAAAYVAWDGSDRWEPIGTVPVPPSQWNVPDATIALHNQTWGGPRIDYLSITADGLPDRPVEPPAPPARVNITPTQARQGVVMHNGAPALSLDGVAQYPMFLFEQEVFDKDAAAFRDAGFRYYSSIEFTRHLDLEWIGDYQFEYTKIDKVLKGFAERLPDRYWLPRVHLYAPKWWLDAHPEEAVGYCLEPPEDELEHAFPPFGGVHKQSYASERWRDEAGEGLRRLVRHLLDSPYRDRIMGIHVAAGIAGEWHPWGPKYLPDTSEPMRRAFVRYLRKKYGTEDALRKAWKDEGLTFDSVRVPTVEERRHADVGLFKDPAKGRAVQDYYEAYNATAVEAIDHFCRIVKEESQGRFLACVLYAYEPDMPYMPKEMDHHGAARAHRLDSVDLFATPHAYWRRDLGEDGALRTFPESLQLHAKVFIDECDEATHLAMPRWFRHASTMEESLQVLWRGFGHTVTHATGMWYMDQSSGQWYDAPEIRAAFKRINRWADYSMTLPRARIHDVAVIANMQSEFYIGAETQLDAQLWVSQHEQLAKAGAPFCRYLIEDLEEGLVPEHKVYIFINCFYLTDGQRAAIEKLKTNGHTLMWFYAPGFVTPDRLSLEAMEDLTGLDFDQSGTPFMEVELKPGLFPDAPPSYKARIARAREEFDEFGKIRDISPRFIPRADGQEVWGTYAGGDEPALVSKDMGDWRSVYTPTAHVPWPVLNRIYREAGVHLYAENGDNLNANESWLMLHTVKGLSGPRRIRLPKPTAVYDAIGERLVLEHGDEFTVDLPPATTALFVFANPGEEK